jgi:hypothetical protein
MNRGFAAGTQHDRLLFARRTRASRQGEQIVSEQETTTPTEITEAIAAVPAEIEPKRAKKKTKTPRTASSAKKGKKSSPKTDEEKRLAKNAALREWRKKNADKFNKYMADWRAAKKAKDKKKSPKKTTTKTAKGGTTA